MMHDDFYIGWSNDHPASRITFRRRFFKTLLYFVVGTILFLSWSENPYINSRFEYGMLTTLEGHIVDYPVLGLWTEIDEQPMTVPLVGFGKYGPEAALEALDMEQIAGAKVTLRGTLIRYQDKVWMELTDGKESILNIRENIRIPPLRIQNTGKQTIEGEIVDPKCFFGVMNPAYRKIHRSCAIRCLSGGIPPVLAIRRDGAFADYYFLLDENGKPLRQSIRQLAGLPVTVAGDVEIVNDWKVMRLTDSVSTLVFTDRLDLMRSIAECRNNPDTP